MASTLTFQDSWSVARQQYAVGIDQTAIQYATNMAISEMWKAYDWRGTVQAFNPFWIVPGEQDYGLPLYAVPSDFYGLREVYLVESASNNQYRHPLLVQSNLERTGYMDFPIRIAYHDEVHAFRLWPCPTFGMSSPFYLVDGTYKIRPPRIVRATLNVVTPWDDIYFEPLVQACAWAALVTSGRRDEAVKQHSIFMQTLMSATAVENLELGEPTVHPSEGLSLFGRPNWWGGLP